MINESTGKAKVQGSTFFRRGEHVTKYLVILIATYIFVLYIAITIGINMISRNIIYVLATIITLQCLAGFLLANAFKSNCNFKVSTIGNKSLWFNFTWLKMEILVAPLLKGGLLDETCSMEGKSKLLLEKCKSQGEPSILKPSTLVNRIFEDFGVMQDSLALFSQYISFRC